MQLTRVISTDVNPGQPIGLQMRGGAMLDTTTLEKVYKVRHVSQHLNVDEDTVYRLLNTGEIRGIKVGRQWRVSETALNDFIAGR